MTTAARDDEFDGTIGRNWKNWTDGVTDEMLSLKAADQVALTLADFERDEWPYWVGWEITSPYTFSREEAQDYFGGTFPWPNQERPRITAVIHHDGQQQTPLWLGSIQQDAGGLEMRVAGPNGSTVTQFQRPGYWRVIRGGSRDGLVALRKTFLPSSYHDGDSVEIEGRTYKVNKYRQVVLESQPLKSPESLYELAARRLVLDEDDAAGFYTITYDACVIQPVPLLPPKRKVWLKVGSDSTMVLSGFQFFYVPADVESFEMSFLPSYNRDRFAAKLALAAGAILNPNAQPVASIRCGLENRPNVVRVEVPPKFRGQTWCIAGSGYCLIGMKGAPPYISPSRATFATEPRVPN